MHRQALSRAGGVISASGALLFAFLLAACTPSLLGGGPPGPAAVTGPVSGEVLGTGAAKAAMTEPRRGAGR